MRSPLGMIPIVSTATPVSWVSAQDVDYTIEPLEQIKAKVESKKTILADVRERREWDLGHLRGAVFLPLSQLTLWEHYGSKDSEKVTPAGSLPKGSVVYCHCAAGGRALPGAEALRKLGYNARPLKPGYRELIEAGFVREPAKYARSPATSLSGREGVNRQAIPTVVSGRVVSA